MAKKIKDPIYGYVEISDTAQKIIDTPAFQRLRDIAQTSYSPLYPSATHNRFIHSIGVYHLGELALNGIKNNSDLENIDFDYKLYFRIFKLACLLHDIGHAPFSHTGEGFYLKDGKIEELHKELIDLVNDEILQQEIDKNGYKAAPHELMSIIVGLKFFSAFLEGKESFFARCIIGYKYTENLIPEKKFQNNLIELLNSKVIDVDKLDYLIRDSYYTGFDTVEIDYNRLLSSLCFVRDSSEWNIGFTKSAISVLENVIYAHDSERKWIQNHPSVIYETYLLEQILDRVMKECFKSDYLTEELLSEKGTVIKGFGCIRLLSDSSIMYLLKNISADRFIQEFLNRSSRKKPLWKSETEFNAIFQDSKNEISIIVREFKNLETYIKKLGFPFQINEEVIKKCETEIDDLEKKYRLGKDALLNERKKYLKMMNILFELIAESEREKGIVIRFTGQFISGFSKKEFAEIKIYFPDLSEPCDFASVTPILNPSNNTDNKNIFYIFSPNGKKDIDIKTLCEKLLSFANDIKVSETTKKFK